MAVLKLLLTSVGLPQQLLCMLEGFLFSDVINSGLETVIITRGWFCLK